MNRNVFPYCRQDHFDYFEDVEAFFRFLIVECGVEVDPFMDFVDVVTEDGYFPFDREQVWILNRLMDSSLEICEDAGIGVYELLASIEYDCRSLMRA